MFEEVEDIFSDKGVTRHCLVMTMRFISLAKHHDIKMCHTNDHNIMFHCVCNDRHKKSETKPVGTAIVKDNFSWDFFLANFRQSLAQFCPEMKLDELVFMRNGHSRVINGIQRHFRGCHHLLNVLRMIVGHGLICENGKHVGQPRKE